MEIIIPISKRSPNNKMSASNNLVNTLATLKYTKVIDVSDMTPYGTNTKIFLRENLPIDRIVIDDLPIASNNYTKYLLATALLGPEYAKYASKYKQVIDAKYSNVSLKSRMFLEKDDFHRYELDIKYGMQIDYWITKYSSYIKDIFKLYLLNSPKNIEINIPKFIATGIDINEYVDNITPLSIICDTHSSPEILLKYGADPNKLDKIFPFYSPLEYSAMRFNNMIFFRNANLLKQYGSDMIVRRSLYFTDIFPNLTQLGASMVPAFNIIDDEIYLTSLQIMKILPQIHVLGKLLKREDPQVFSTLVIRNIIEKLLANHNISVEPKILNFLTEYSTEVHNLQKKRHFMELINRYLLTHK